MEVHRPTVKQQNKPHKPGKHKTKGELKRQAQGRVSVKTLSKRNKKNNDKQARRSQANQKRKQKREDLLNKKRTKGGASGAPIHVAVIGLSEAVDTRAVVEVLKSCDEEATASTNDLGITHINVPRFRQRLSFSCPQTGDLYAALDAVKAADTVLMVVDSDRAYDDYGEYCLSCLMAQGLPTPILACQGLKELPQKRQNDGKKLLQKAIAKLFPDEKLHCVDTGQEGLQLLRVLGNHKLKDVSYRDKRPYLLAEELSFELPSQESLTGTLKLTGYVRAQTLSVNQLLHVPGWGDFRLLQLDAPRDPYALGPAPGRSRHNSENDMDSGDVTVRVLERADPTKQPSLQAEAEVDPMEGEQTWPTEEELAQADADAAERKSLRRVPRGTSEYQAAWILDQPDDITDDEDDDSMGDAMEDAVDDGESDEAEGEESMDGETEGTAEPEEDEYETISVKFGAEVRYDNAMDLAEEEAMLNKYREARQQEQFPDEVDTPQDVPARLRFQKYRGLKSFRTSPWDCKENLPLDYARIFQFENFNRTRKRVLQLRDEAQGALPGWYVTAHIADVPKEFMESYTPGTPVVAFGLLEHEHRMSVCNYMLTRTQNYSRPIKSKEQLVFHVGFRRFSASPVFSQHTNGDKHKFERFLRPGGVYAATVYAPIMFPTAPVLMFKQTHSGRHEIVASGSMISVNPDRIVAKRLVLSGHPFKINKRSATVRYMFFNREDIQWFKPVELRTKWGRRGHIRDMLGTHGHMKCVFDGQLKSQDTVLMNLYKRMFPKWTYSARVPAPVVSTDAPAPDSGMEELAEELFD